MFQRTARHTAAAAIAIAASSANAQLHAIATHQQLTNPTPTTFVAAGAASHTHPPAQQNAQHTDTPTEHVQEQAFVFRMGRTSDEHHLALQQRGYSSQAFAIHSSILTNYGDMTGDENSKQAIIDRIRDRYLPNNGRDAQWALAFTGVVMLDIEQGYGLWELPNFSRDQRVEVIQHTGYAIAAAHQVFPRATISLYGVPKPWGNWRYDPNDRRFKMIRNAIANARNYEHLDAIHPILYARFGADDFVGGYAALEQYYRRWTNDSMTFAADIAAAAQAKGRDIAIMPVSSYRVYNGNSVNHGDILHFRDNMLLTSIGAIEHELDLMGGPPLSMWFERGVNGLTKAFIDNLHALYHPSNPVFEYPDAPADDNADGNHTSNLSEDDKYELDGLRDLDGDNQDDDDTPTPESNHHDVFHTLGG